ncbi:hypothetical protein [Leptolyngbya sp. Heron Island J]|nr:hypothetical protein [Leptolyngbya sp. Heron Island J]
MVDVTFIDINQYMPHRLSELTTCPLVAVVVELSRLAMRSHVTSSRS